MAGIPHRTVSLKLRSVGGVGVINGSIFGSEPEKMGYNHYNNGSTSHFLTSTASHSMRLSHNLGKPLNILANHHELPYKVVAGWFRRVYVTMFNEVQPYCLKGSAVTTIFRRGWSPSISCGLHWESETLDLW